MLYKIPNSVLDLLMPIARSTNTTPFQLIEEAILNQIKESMHDQRDNKILNS